MKKLNIVYPYLPGLFLRFSITLSCYTAIQLIFSDEWKAALTSGEIFLALFIVLTTKLFGSLIANREKQNLS